MIETDVSSVDLSLDGYSWFWKASMGLMLFIHQPRRRYVLVRFRGDEKCHLVTCFGDKRSLAKTRPRYECPVYSLK